MMMSFEFWLGSPGSRGPRHDPITVGTTETSCCQTPKLQVEWLGHMGKSKILGGFFSLLAFRLVEWHW